MRFLHHDRTLLSPDALGGVIRFHVGGHSILHGTGDVLLDNIGTVVSERENGWIRRWDCKLLGNAHHLFPGITATSLKHNIEREREQVLRDNMSWLLLNTLNVVHLNNRFSPSSPATCFPLSRSSSNRLIRSKLQGAAIATVKC